MAKASPTPDGFAAAYPHADLGCSMETVMAHYMSNHIAVAYGDIFGELVAASQALGFRVRVMG
jgi:hypothetical protein